MRIKSLVLEADSAWGAVVTYVSDFSPASPVTTGLRQWLLLPCTFGLDCNSWSLVLQKPLSSTMLMPLEDPPPPCNSGIIGIEEARIQSLVSLIATITGGGGVYLTCAFSTSHALVGEMPCPRLVDGTMQQDLCFPGARARETSVF